MRKGILKNLILGSICIVLISFILVGTFFISVLTKTSIDEKVKALNENVPKISELSSIAMNGTSGRIMAIYHSVIDSISANTDAYIIVFDSNGTIITASGHEKSKFIGSSINEELSGPILSGKRYHKTGMLDEYFNESTLTVGAPMHSNGELIGGVVFNLPVPEIRSMNLRIFKSFASMSLIVIVFSIILYYFISRRITTPIKRMNVAVTEFAKGNFAKRVQYNGNDEIGQLATNFNAMATSLENLENMRSSFVANVSHELRTPMTTISGFLEGILDGTINEEDREKYLEIALDETKRLSRLVNDLLKISRIENSEFELNKESFSINELITRELFKFEGCINDKNIQVELELADDSPNVRADMDAITQVVTNLVHNAVKFTPEDGEISVKTYVKDKKVYAEITNSGSGIAEDKLKFVFDRFYKTDDSRSHDKSGVGLGLFIVKSLINRHGEKITVESEEGKFTKFIFTLPVG